jgi:putative acetyltransferase
MTDSPIIREEQPGDFAAIRTLVAAAFGSDAEADLVEAIRASPEYIPELALVAEIDGEVVGHVMISGATLRSNIGDQSVVMLAPLAVTPAHQRRGIGGELVRAACSRAEQQGAAQVFLEGGPAYYSRLGFEPAYEYDIELPLPDWAPPEAGQLLRLSGFDPNLKGRLVYPPAFAELPDD